MTATGAEIAPLLNDFVRGVPGVTHALFTSSDGFPLACSDTLDDERAERLAAMSSGLISLARGGAKLFDKGDCEQIIIRLTEGYFLFMGIDAGGGLAVLTEAGADLKGVGYETTRFVAGASTVLTPQARTGLRRVADMRYPPG